jgi:hypothetical protein
MILSTIWYFLTGQYFLTCGVVESWLILSLVGVIVYGSLRIIKSVSDKVYKTVKSAAIGHEKTNPPKNISAPKIKVSAQKAIADDIKLRMGLFQYRGKYRRINKIIWQFNNTLSSACGVV